jgi:hypothetical protein
MDVAGGAADEEGPRAREFQKRETPPNTPKGRRRTLGGGARAAASGVDPSVDSPRLPQAFSNPYQPQVQARCTTAMLTVVGALLLALSLLLFTAARHGRGGPADEIDWLLGRGRAHGVAGLAETERQRVARAFFEAPSAAGDHVRRAMHAFHRADGGARYVGAGDDHGGGGGRGGRGGAGGGGADLRAEDVDAAAAAAAAAGTWGPDGFEDGAADAGAEEIFIEREDGGQLLRGVGGSPREAGM